MRRRIALWIAAILLLGAGRAAPTLLTPEPPEAWTWRGLPGCTAAGRAADQWMPHVANADRYLDATYRCGEVLVAVHVAEFYSQQPGKEAVGGANRVAEDPGPVVRLKAADTEAGFPVNRYRFTNARGEEVSVWQWYSVGNEPVADDGRAKLIEAWHLLSLDPEPSGQFLIAVIGPQPGSEALLRTGARSVWSGYLGQRP